MKHFLRCLLYIAALGVVFFVVGRLVPKSWFKADHFPWRCYSYEQAIWKALRVKQWQAKVPDMSRIFTNIMPAKKLKRQTLSDLQNDPRNLCCRVDTRYLIDCRACNAMVLAWYRRYLHDGRLHFARQFAIYCGTAFQPASLTKITLKATAQYANSELTTI